MSYLGSRTHRLLTGWLFNRALPVEGGRVDDPDSQHPGGRTSGFSMSGAS